MGEWDDRRGLCSALYLVAAALGPTHLDGRPLALEALVRPAVALHEDVARKDGGVRGGPWVVVVELVDDARPVVEGEHLVAVAHELRELHSAPLLAVLALNLVLRHPLHAERALGSVVVQHAVLHGGHPEGFLLVRDALRPLVQVGDDSERHGLRNRVRLVGHRSQLRKEAEQGEPNAQGLGVVGERC